MINVRNRRHRLKVVQQGCLDGLRNSDSRSLWVPVHGIQQWIRFQQAPRKHLIWLGFWVYEPIQAVTYKVPWPTIKSPDVRIRRTYDFSVAKQALRINSLAQKPNAVAFLDVLPIHVTAPASIGFEAITLLNALVGIRKDLIPTVVAGVPGQQVGWHIANSFPAESPTSVQNDSTPCVNIPKPSA